MRQHVKTEWKGKEARQLTVGSAKHADYSTIQGALDAIETAGDNAIGNRYLVVVQPGIYDERVTHDLSYVDVVGESAGACIVRQDSSVTTTGGTFRVGTSGSVQDVTISSLRIIRDSGGAMMGSQPPEGAMYVGAEETYPSTPTFEDITIENCRIEGVHDALQCFGADDTYAGKAPAVLVQNCRIYSTHDAVTMKGAMDWVSSGNIITVDTRLPFGYLTDSGEDWKSTGFHVNINRPELTGEFSCWGRRFISNGDIIRMYDGSNVGAPLITGQDTLAGYYFYDNAGSTWDAVRTMHPIVVVGPLIEIDYDRDYSPSNHVAGVNIVFPESASGGANAPYIPRGNCLIQGGAIRVRNHNTGSSAPATIWGVRLQGDDVTNRSWCRVVDCDIEGLNRANSDTGNVYACGAFAARAGGATIEHRITSSLTNDTGGTGTLAQLALVT